MLKNITRITDKMKTVFMNAKEMHAMHPDTFSVPSDSEINALKPGSIVKVCCNNERFWVQLTEVDTASSQLKGVVNNELVAPENSHLSLGTEIEFKNENILSIYDEDDAVMKFYIMNKTTGGIKAVEDETMRAVLAKAILKNEKKDIMDVAVVSGLAAILSDPEHTFNTIREYIQSLN